MIRFLAVLLSVSLVVACGTPGSSQYTTSEVGKPVELAPGSVISSRLVTVQGDSSLVGPAAGGALGGAGSGWGFQSGWAAVIGAVVGAGAGYLTQNAVTGREGIEYVVQMSDGRVLTLVQNRDSTQAPIANGTPVLVQLSGPYSRVIVDPRAPAHQAPAAVAAAPAGNVPPTSAPVTPAPVTPAPVTPAPVTSAPVTSAPETPVASAPPAPPSQPSSTSAASTVP